MNKITESKMELIAIALLEKIGFRCVYGPDVAPERERFEEVLLLAVSTAALAGMGLLLSGRLAFEPDYPVRMVEYLVGAFPQQFFMYSVGLVTWHPCRSFTGHGGCRWWSVSYSARPISGRPT